MKTLHRQRGVTLFMSMIMLVILTLLALSSFNISHSNMQVVSNMQQRDQSLFAARAVLEEVISGTRFTTKTQTLVAQPNCTGGDNHRCIDTNGDGSADVTVRVVGNTQCVKARTILINQLDMNTAEVSCAIGENGLPGVEGAGTGASRCVDSVWEVRAEAKDNLTDATVTVTQGIAVMAELDTIKTACPN